MRFSAALALGISGIALLIFLNPVALNQEDTPTLNVQAIYSKNIDEQTLLKMSNSTQNNTCLNGKTTCEGHRMSNENDVALPPEAKISSYSLLEMEGIWQSRGYGWLWRIHKKQLETYDITQNFCQRQAEIDFKPRKKQVLVDHNYPDSFQIAIDDPAYWLRFDKISALPPPCQQKKLKDPLAVFDMAVELFNAHYPFFKERNIDWARQTALYRHQLNRNSTEKQLYKTLTELLSTTHDGHVTLEARIKGKFYEFDAELKRPKNDPCNNVLQLFNFSNAQAQFWTPGIGDELVTGKWHKRANGRIRYGMISDDTGLLELREMEGFGFKALRKALDEAMKLFASARFLIVDVSQNDGGYDSIARKIASRFADKQTLAYYKFAGDDPEAVPQAIYIKPSERQRFTGSVALITGQRTSSAAEIFTLAMRSLPNVVHFGQPTEGILSDMLWKTLPNKWQLSLSNEIYLDHKKISWEARGVKPEIDIELYPSRKKTSCHINAAKQTVDFLRKTLMNKK